MKSNFKFKVVFSSLIMHVFYCVLFVSSSLAQDIHFSQVNLTPLLLNPALTGLGGDHRAIVNYKKQWSGMGKPGATYSTTLFSYDTRLLAKRSKAGFVGAGINAYKDVAGDLQLGTTQVNISISGVVNISRKQFLSGGLQAGYVQKSISTANMQWDSQYDETSGTYNSGLQSNDVVAIPPYLYGDFSAGLAYGINIKQSSVRANNQKKFNIGASAYHVNRPDQKLNPYNIKTTDKMYAKIIVHSSATFGIPSTNYEIIPSAVYFMQGPSTEINVGSMLRWIIKGASRYTGYVQGMALSFGAQYRVGDAVIPMVLFEYSNLSIGLCYDVNTSALIQGTKGKGGLEVSLKYATPNPFRKSSSRLLD